MSYVQFSRIDLGQLYPPFVDRLGTLISEALAEGVSYWALSGHRDFAEQAKLYAQGRTTPGAIVTNANAGESAHNFGLAVDFCRDGLVERAGLQPDWRRESYTRLGELAAKHGLVWGGTFHNFDGPHVQWGRRITGADMEPLRKAFSAGGLNAVWAFLDSEALGG